MKIYRETRPLPHPVSFDIKLCNQVEVVLTASKHQANMLGLG